MRRTVGIVFIVIWEREVEHSENSRDRIKVLKIETILRGCRRK